MRLVLVGPPGSGKGTQATRLVERLGLTYVGTGDILREAIRLRTPAGVIVEPLIKRGLLAPDPLVNEVVAELFRGPHRPERFVLDGYPRTYAQAVAFDALMRQEFLKLDAVINLAIDDEDVVKRISYRRLCANPACGALYHLMASPPKVTRRVRPLRQYAGGAVRRQGGDRAPPPGGVPRPHRRTLGALRAAGAGAERLGAGERGYNLPPTSSPPSP